MRKATPKCDSGPVLFTNDFLNQMLFPCAAAAAPKVAATANHYLDRRALTRTKTSQTHMIKNIKFP